ncbi:MAG: endolytic transglycosylase MltG [Lysobacteraceae bacterium]|nr:MAG: endolytic transglycosylase MltG [Xanthomonadaceae bacterium]
MSIPHRLLPAAPARGFSALRALVLLLFLGVLAAGAYAWHDYRGFADAPLPVQRDDQTLVIERGAGFRAIVSQMRRDDLVPNNRLSELRWRLLARELGVDGSLHAGEYALPRGITPRELLRRMAAGEVVQHRFTIVDGWTFRQLRTALATESGLKQTLTTATDEDIARRVGVEGVHPEGWFLPETYAWVRGESDLDVLVRAHAAMKKALGRLWGSRAPDVLLKTPYEALILASIVEKETGRAGERAEIAGVFMRRIKYGMRLQTDPTVIYGIGRDWDGNIRRRDLETDTPYNTYTRDGLPPTPIALPGVPAIEAALHPAPGDALYFVARGDGSHEFSPTLDAHNRAVRKYQLRRE